MTLGLLILSALSLAAAAVPAMLFLRNLPLFHKPGAPMLAGDGPAVSVCIPARNEEAVIARVIESVLQSNWPKFELLVLDDNSTDATAAIVKSFVARDNRVKLHAAPALPPGWCGKQHACWVLAGLAAYEVLLFLDADEWVEPHAIGSIVNYLQASPAGLISGFPRQKTVTLIEKLVLPLIQFVLLGFLPLHKMRQSVSPAYAAGCGQLFAAKKHAYFAAGGHEAIKASRHDGLKLPRAFRRAGVMTDVFDASQLVTCRMYLSGGEVFTGLAKNAVEAMAAPRLLVPATAILLLGQVAPFVLLPIGLALGDPWAGAIAAVAVVLAWLPRWVGVRRFGQSALGALLHPLGITLLLIIQWYALLRHVMGKPLPWKGRSA
ncbi:MAG: glycosyltransferase family 2 protein [Phycisphaerae bacterium]